MYDDDYNEEEDKVFSREGGIFQIDTPDLKEFRGFKENVRKSNKFNFVKLTERSDNTMFDDYELRDLIEEFNEEIDEDVEKKLKIMSPELQKALGECYAILVKFKEDLKEISPELFSAVELLGKLALGKPPGEYPYPVKKSQPVSWQGMQDMLFGGHIRSDDEDEEIEKSSKENPFPSITKAIKIRKEALDELDEELEEGNSDYYDDEDE